MCWLVVLAPSAGLERLVWRDRRQREKGRVMMRSLSRSSRRGAVIAIAALSLLVPAGLAQEATPTDMAQAGGPDNGNPAVALDAIRKKLGELAPA